MVTMGDDGSASYWCNCGRLVTVPASRLVPDESINYCGCSRGRKVVFHRDIVADHRKSARLPDLSE
jgi:hypothetical protein